MGTASKTGAQGGGQGIKGQVTCTGSGHVVRDTGSTSNRPWAQALPPLPGLVGVHVPQALVGR